MPTAQAQEHSVSFSERREAKKSSGVYYTPAYIVDYIVKQTIGKAISEKTPAVVSKLRIVDPSCGSGNFLIGAYQFLLDWHRIYYRSKNKLNKNKSITVLTAEGNLTTAEKKRILFNNIYGVDLDANAVEATKLVLISKCSEGNEGKHISTVDKARLPALDDNIKAGNSLVDTDFYDTKRRESIEKNAKVFNWREEFPIVFSRGGFDIVIGNPPYGASLSKEVQYYCLQKFGTGNTDTAALFMIQAKQILKPHGYNGYIVPKSFTYASNWERTRKELLPDISMLADCSKVWPGVKLEMSIYISRKNLTTKQFVTSVRKGKEIVEIGTIDKSLCDKFNFILNGVSDKEIRAAIKLFNSPKRLNDFFINRRGATLQQHVATTGDYQVIGGKQVQRYFLKNDIERRIKKTNITEEDAFIKKNSLLVQNIVAHIENPFPHIQISATMPDSESASECVLLDTVNQLTNRTTLSLAYLLGVLNSRPVSWYTCKFVFANAIRTMHFDNTTTERIPFPDIDLTNKKHKASYDVIIHTVMLIAAIKNNDNEPGRKTLSNQKIAVLQHEIDMAVCELFGLSEVPMATK